MKPRKAYCPTCRLVDYVDGNWACRWCETRTLGRRAKPKHPQRRMMTVALMREAHTLHAEGATIREAADAIYPRTKYADPRDLRMLLPCAWAALGLPYRTIRDAQIVRYANQPHPLSRLDVTPEAAVAAVERLGSQSAAAVELGVSRKTLRKRLRKAGR